MQFTTFHIALLTLIFFASTTCSVTGQMQSPECELRHPKYLSTFSGHPLVRSSPSFSATQINLMTEAVEKQQQFSHIHIPLIMSIISGYYEKSAWTDEEKDIIIASANLYSAITGEGALRNDDRSNPAICKTLDKMVGHYHALCKDDAKIHLMLPTIDPGPMYGIDTDPRYAVKDSLFLEDMESVLYLSEEADTSTLELVDRQGQVRWRKIIVEDADYPLRLRDKLGSDNWIEIQREGDSLVYSVPDSSTPLLRSRKRPIQPTYLNEVRFADDAVRLSNDLLYTILLLNGPQSITLYLRKDGRFMFYYLEF